MPNPLFPPVAIMGMSADPAHKGHLKVAEAVHDLGYSRVVMMVTPQNPFKKTAQTPYEHRMALARLLIGRRPWLELSDAEAWVQLLSEDLRTHTLLTHLRTVYPNTPFTFVMGSDNWLHFHEWGKSTEILELCGILVVPRPGSMNLIHAPAALALGHRKDTAITGPVPQGRWRIHPDIPGGQASSTHIRKAIAAGQAAPYITPAQAEYIGAHGLYRPR